MAKQKRRKTKYMIYVNRYEFYDYIINRNFYSLDEAQTYLEWMGYRMYDEHEYTKEDSGITSYAQICRVNTSGYRSVAVDGVEYSLLDLAKKYGLQPQTVRLRYLRGERGKDLIKPTGSKSRLKKRKGDKIEKDS